MASASSSHSHKALGLSTEDGSTLENSTDDDSIQSRPATVEPKPLRFTRSISPLALRRNIDPKESIPANSAQQASHGRGRSSSLRSSHTTGHHHHQPRKSVHLFRRYYSFNPYIPRLSAQIDTRKLLEHLILFTAVTVALAQFSVSPNVVHELWIIRELGTLAVVSALYLVVTRTPAGIPPVYSNIEHGHRPHGLTGVPKDFMSKTSLIWMTTPKDYRSDADDGVLTALLLGPIATASMLYGSLITNKPGRSFHPPGWLIESPAYLSKSFAKIHPREALLNSRRNLVQLSTLCSFVLLTHLCTSNLASSNGAHTKHEDGWKKMKRGWRSWSFIGYAASITVVAVTVHVICNALSLQIWKDLSHLDVALISSFYQLSVYVMLRLSHGGFTLGEAGIVALGSTTLFMEGINMTIAQIWPLTTPYIKTTRYPDPLLIYQIALLPGSLLIGFLLSPLLVLSRHTSQLPAHRLKRNPHDRHSKKPMEREIQRRFLAFAFYFFAALVIFGLIGSWTRWCLGGRNPWIWAVFWLTEGSARWTRPSLLFYWALLGSFSVAAWGRQLARSRKFQRSNMAMNGNGMPAGSSFADAPLPSPISNGFTHVATDLLDAADKRVPTLSLNARRKSFHAVALCMFLPGIILDPAFTHFCFSAAFALFVFAEYIRYFALYPFGRFVHIFLNEFVDSKDSGSAILSHFYLLTGFASSLWLEGPWRFLEFTGTLSLGIGDSMASIVGRRIGRLRWSEGNPKTIEGSLAFFLSVFLANLFLRAFGIIESFYVSRYSIVLAAGCFLEAVSNQNDNLTIPVFIWSMTVLCNVVQT